MWRAGIIDCHSVQCSLVIDTHLTVASERLPSNCQTAAAAIVVCIAARVLNKMSMMTSLLCVSGEGSRRGEVFM